MKMMQGMAAMLEMFIRKDRTLPHNFYDDSSLIYIPGPICRDNPEAYFKEFHSNSTTSHFCRLNDISTVITLRSKE